MERNKDQGENFPCKGARKIEFPGYNEGFTCGIQPGKIYARHVTAYIGLSNREGTKIEGY